MLPGEWRSGLSTLMSRWSRPVVACQFRLTYNLQRQGGPCQSLSTTSALNSTFPSLKRNPTESPGSQTPKPLERVQLNRRGAPWPLVLLEFDQSSYEWSLQFRLAPWQDIKVLNKRADSVSRPWHPDPLSPSITHTTRSSRSLLTYPP